jgi:hypothetical protein
MGVLAETHLIIVTCTEFFQPLDLSLLPKERQRSSKGLSSTRKSLKLFSNVLHPQESDGRIDEWAQLREKTIRSGTITSPDGVSVWNENWRIFYFQHMPARRQPLKFSSPCYSGCVSVFNEITRSKVNHNEI